MRLPRLALFTLEALPNEAAVRRFVENYAGEIAFIGLSDAGGAATGGLLRQTWRHVRQSGPMILPYLVVNFGIPVAVRAAYPITSKFGRRRAVAETPIDVLCRRRGIPSRRVCDVNDAEVAALFDAHRPDLIVSFHLDQIFSAETLARAPLGGINVHPSLLPRHRGPVPTIHALAEDRPAFGVSIHKLVERIDAGAVLAQAPEMLPANMSATEAAIRLHDRGRTLLETVLSSIGADGMPEGRQCDPLPYCPFPSAALLRDMRRRRRRLTTWRDVRFALGAPALAATVGATDVSLDAASVTNGTGVERS